MLEIGFWASYFIKYKLKSKIYVSCFKQWPDCKLTALNAHRMQSKHNYVNWLSKPVKYLFTSFPPSNLKRIDHRMNLKQRLKIWTVSLKIFSNLDSFCITICSMAVKSCFQTVQEIEAKQETERLPRITKDKPDTH